MADPIVSIVIPVFNRASLTRAILDALLAGQSGPPLELIVVDDASSDETPKLLGGYRDRIRVVTQVENQGFGRACNDGAAAASGSSEFLLFLNNDISPCAGWLDALVDHARTHDAAGVVGSKLLFPNDTVQHAGVVICQDLLPRHIYAGFPAEHPAVEKSRQFRIVTGGCSLVRREVFDALGGFDDAFLNGYEDVDFCLRAGEAGWEVHYCHRSVLYHYESLSRDRSLDNKVNGRRYLERWADTLAPDDVSYFVEDGLLEIAYRDTYPLEFRVSPELAAVAGDDRLADRLLHERAGQVMELLRMNIRRALDEGELPRAGRD